MRRLYSDMIEARTYDHKCMALQRQGRLATYAPSRARKRRRSGRDRCDQMIGSPPPIATPHSCGGPDTWSLLVAGRTGDERGGRPPEGVNVLAPSITVGGHMIHAVGLALGRGALGIEPDSADTVR